MLASMHILDVDRDYVQNTIMNNLKSDFFNTAFYGSKLLGSITDILGEDLLHHHFFGMKSDRAYSLFCDKFGLKSINEDALQLSIIKGGRVIQFTV